MANVTHPSEGIYLSKFLAGVIGTVLSTGMIAGFANLWYLNRKIIEFDNHMIYISSANATLPGALSRVEWSLEKDHLSTQLNDIKLSIEQLRLEINDNKSTK